MEMATSWTLSSTCTGSDCCGISLAFLCLSLVYSLFFDNIEQFIVSHLGTEDRSMEIDNVGGTHVLVLPEEFEDSIAKSIAEV